MFAPAYESSRSAVAFGGSASYYAPLSRRSSFRKTGKAERSSPENPSGNKTPGTLLLLLGCFSSRIGRQDSLGGTPGRGGAAWKFARRTGKNSCSVRYRRRKAFLFTAHYRGPGIQGRSHLSGSPGGFGKCGFLRSVLEDGTLSSHEERTPSPGPPVLSSRKLRALIGFATW